MINIRKSEERGFAEYDWLKTYHTFSFNTYYDAKNLNFRSLRVINEDTIQPAQGFGTHPHRDMEIITYVTQGALEHKDSMNNGSIIRPRDVQRMSAGTGILHSEFNASEEELVHLLQIWILPNKKSVKPGYEQTTFTRDKKLNQLRLIASSDGGDGSVKINQDASVFAAILERGSSIDRPIAKNRHAWIQVVGGNINLTGLQLISGDGAAISEEKSIKISALEESEFLLFDLD